MHLSYTSSLILDHIRCVRLPPFQLFSVEHSHWSGKLPSKDAHVPTPLPCASIHLPNIFLGFVINTVKFSCLLSRLKHLSQQFCFGPLFLAKIMKQGEVLNYQLMHQESLVRNVIISWSTVQHFCMGTHEDLLTFQTSLKRPLDKLQGSSFALVALA